MHLLFIGKAMIVWMLDLKNFTSNETDFIFFNPEFICKNVVRESGLENQTD